MTWVAHYLDDFITMGTPDSQECRSNLGRMLATCQCLGVPVAHRKCVGPATTLVFLGFEQDSVELEIRLPADKLQHTLLLVREWITKKSCRKRDLESLLGHLQHAATVVRPGRTFVRRIIELISTVESRAHWIRLNASIRSDLMWWLLFLEDWNGVGMLPRV